MRVRRRWPLVPLIAWATACAWTFAASDTATATMKLETSSAHVGDRIAATLTVEAPPGTSLVTRALGPQLGKFSVFDGAWATPEAGDGARTYRWTGSLSAYETGELVVPSIELTVQGEGADSTVRTEPVKVEIASVLGSEKAAGDEIDIADLKPPASMAPNYRPLWVASGLLAAMLFVAGVAWWLHRRFAARLAAVPAPEDPFHRMPPHEWVYRELGRLLERRIAEQGYIDAFYGELSRILKRYLGGRFRVDLMERTTSEIGPMLEQAGAARSGIAAALELLVECDRVKFARERPGPDAWRRAVERVYGVVDRTKPSEVRTGAVAEQGAA